jgi:hypothetical protein
MKANGTITISLDEFDSMLEKIERLEKELNDKELIEEIELVSTHVSYLVSTTQNVDGKRIYSRHVVQLPPRTMNLKAILSIEKQVESADRVDKGTCVVLNIVKLD